MSATSTETSQTVIRLIDRTDDHLGRPVLVIDSESFHWLQTYRDETWTEVKGYGYGESQRVHKDTTIGMKLFLLHALSQEMGHPFIVCEGYKPGTVPMPSLRDVDHVGDDYFFCG